MTIRLIVSAMFFFLAMPAFSQTNVCLDSGAFVDNLGELIAEALDDGGYGSDENVAQMLYGPRAVESALALEQFVKSERLSRSGATVLKHTKTLQGSPVPVESFSEVIPLPGLECNGTPVSLAREMNPERVARLRSETIMPNEAMAVGMQGYGQGLLMVGGMLEQMSEESPFGPLFNKMIGGSGSNEARIATIANAGSGAEECWTELDKMGDKQVLTYVTGKKVQPWESMNPLHFMMGPACFAMAISERFAVDLSEDGMALLDAQKAAFEGARTLGPFVDDFDGRPAYRFDIDGLNLSQSTTDLEPYRDEGMQYASVDIRPPSESRSSSFASFQPPPMLSNSFVSVATATTAIQGGSARSAAGGEGSMTIHKISLWIDAQKIVRLKTRMEGVLQQDGQSRDIFLETELKDYRTVQGTSLYEPYREIMRVGGVMDAKQQAEMQEAMKKMDEYERQMASMPESQRTMMEKMMGPQMAQMRSMVNGGAVEFEIITTSIEINPDLTAPASLPSSLAPNVVQIVQTHLVTLGYEPGNTDGVLTKQTVVAISKYQAANGMEVTGEATPQLAGVLAAAVDAMQ